ncbi:MAG: DUF4340 domain-containing protein, partial [Planctomycetota bacterium]|nr:DUF4340 domain-containing protein [Planctomycetota bacterium]
VGLARLTVLDAKTSKPELYSRLGVQDPGPGNADGRRIAIGNADAILADLIVGKRREGAGKASHFVRRADEAESYLVAGDLDFSIDETTWLDKQVLKVAGDRIQSVRVSHADGELLLVDKSEEGQKNYDVQGVPEGSTLRYETIANAMGTALNYLNFTDVLPAAELSAEPTVEAESTYTCFDGLTVVVETFTIDEKPFARFHAAVSDAPSSSFDVPQVLEVPDGDETAPAAPARDLAALEQEAAAIQAKVGPWVYEISPYTRDIFARRMADLVNAPVVDEDTVEIPSPPAPGTVPPSVPPAPEVPTPPLPSDEG